MRYRLMVILLLGGILFVPASNFVFADLLPAQSPPEDEAIFQLPFNTSPSPDTWYVIQFYGNTHAAYIYKSQWYGGGQGMHFGIDFSARCGTEVVAIGDGIVIKVDAAEHGAGPHNLMILHEEAGYASFYGHLLEQPQLAIYQTVKAGEVVALTGDPDLSCSSRPHLHLEIRSTGLYYAYNPVPLIDADWDTLALFGPISSFQRDLQNPRRWMSPSLQPEIQFGGGFLNDYKETWPPEW